MIISCIVRPGSKTEGVSKLPDGTLRIKIRARAEKGQANEYLVQYLANHFNLSSSQISIISGFTGTHKKLNIVGDEKRVNDILKTP